MTLLVYNKSIETAFLPLCVKIQKEFQRLGEPCRIFDNRTAQQKTAFFLTKTPYSGSGWNNGASGYSTISEVLSSATINEKQPSFSKEPLRYRKQSATRCSMLPIRLFLNSLPPKRQKS